MFDWSSLPPGLFSTFLEIWEKLRFVMVDILAFFTQHTFEIVGYGSFSILDFMLGSGLFVFFVVVLIRFVISLFTGG